MFPAIATLMAAGHGFAAIVALMGLGALGFAVETYSGTNYGADDSLLGTFGPYVDAFMGGVEYTAGGAIGQTQGSVLLHGSSALAMTLAAPVAGTPANGGNDFQKLDIFADSTGAHTVTTPSNGINGNKHIATFGGAAGDKISLIAFGGVWYATGLNGVTLS